MSLNRKIMYFHHFADLAQKTVPDIANKVKQAGCGELAGKIVDGTQLMAIAGYDSGLSPANLDALRRLYDDFGAQGVKLVPYCVPLGQDWRVEASAAVNVGKCCGNDVEVDLEPYNQFWEVAATRGAVNDYARVIKDAGMFLRINMDMRSGGVDPFPRDQLADALSVADIVLSQTYYNWFDSMSTSKRGATTFPTNATGYSGGTGWVDLAIDKMKGLGVAPQKRGVIADSGGWQKFGDTAIALDLRDGKTLGLWHLANASDTVLWAFSAVGGGSGGVQTITVEKIVEVVKEVIKEVEVSRCPDRAATAAKVAEIEGVVAAAEAALVESAATVEAWRSVALEALATIKALHETGG